jgi:hypothetical protein
VTRTPIVLFAVVGLGCAHKTSRELERASRDLAQAVGKGNAADIRASVVPGARGQVDTKAMLAGPAKRQWQKALANPEQVQPEAIVHVAPDMPVRAVWTDAGWRFAEDPTDIYGQSTPRQALRALVLASRFERWDVLVSLAPKRYRMGLSADDLRDAWKKGEHAEVLRAARDRVAEHLADPIVADAHEAVLEIAPGHVARLEREGDRWVIVDFLPEAAP